MDVIDRRMLMGRVLAQMANGQEELFIVPENSFSNTIYLDDYLSTVIDGWNTEFILLAYKSGGLNANGLLGCFSKYAIDNWTGFGQIWRGNNNGTFQNNVSRNDWSISLKQGSVYRVIRNPMTIIPNS